MSEQNNTGTKKCKYCKSEIDAEAKICPVCKKRQSGHGCLTAILIAIAVIIVIFTMAMCSSSDDDNNTVVEPTQQAQTSSENNASATAVPADPTDEPEENVPTEYRSALNQAKTYSDMMHMSKQGIYDQLVSEYGGQFTPEAAQYAIDNVDADWNQNALEKARTYQETMSMSPAAIRDQLISEYGEKFTEEEADYAIAHLE